MTPRQIELVQSTFAMVAPAAEQVAASFYARLFELDPDLRALFKGDMAEQGRKLMRTLNLAVSTLDDFGAILPAVEELGRRHHGYGVQEEHYDTVGTALLDTLEEGLGPRFTKEVEHAWRETYRALATVMKEAQSQVARI